MPSASTTTPPRSTTPRGDASRRRIVQAARDELVERRGALEIDSVSRRAGSSVGLIYRHFGSRAGLVVAVVDEFYARLRTELLDAATSGPFVARERRRVEVFVAFHLADPLAPVILDRLHVDVQVALDEAARIDVLVADVAASVTTAQRKGEAPRDRDPLLAGALAVGGLRQVLATALGAEPKPQERRVARQAWLLVAGALGVDPADV